VKRVRTGALLDRYDVHGGAGDDAALPETAEHDLEQAAVLVRRTPHHVPGARHDLERLHVVDLTSEVCRSGDAADPADRKGAAYRELRVAGDDRRGKAETVGRTDQRTPQHAGVDIRANGINRVDGVQRGALDDESRRQALPMRRVRLPPARHLDAPRTAITNHHRDVRDRSRAQDSGGTVADDVAPVGRDRIAGRVIDQQRAIERRHLIEWIPAIGFRSGDPSGPNPVEANHERARAERFQQIPPVHGPPLTASPPRVFHTREGPRRGLHRRDLKLVALLALVRQTASNAHSAPG
jgi:hypothetical protein